MAALLKATFVPTGSWHQFGKRATQLFTEFLGLERLLLSNNQLWQRSTQASDAVQHGRTLGEAKATNAIRM